jgi:hypothetical protein
MPSRRRFLASTLAAPSILRSLAQLPSEVAAEDSYIPYDGPSRPEIDTTTLSGKVMCGYQGWFNAPGDGSDLGWVHYDAGDRFEPGRCTIDLWPDMSEMSDDERYPTSFRHADGSTATVFSSRNRKTVLRHFAWMKQHGHDGIFLQRFASSLKRSAYLQNRNAVTSNVQAGANQYGRTWAMMYDLSGLREGDIDRVLKEDWKHLVDEMRILEDPAYLHHNGAPLIAVWGIGFNDDRRYSLEECDSLIRFLKDDPRYGGNTVMVGAPTGWRTGRRDALPDPLLQETLRKADVISPWTVGRYATPYDVGQHIEKTIHPDLDWCDAEGKLFLPVAFPGFSWHNLKSRPGRVAPLNQIPRLKGVFFESQTKAYAEAGAESLYVAMFDEIDEATAIFKCTNDPPVGESPFLTYEGLPSDHYLKLVGQAAQRLQERM